MTILSPLSAAAQQERPRAIEDFSENSLIIASAKYLGATAESMAEVIDRIFSRYGKPSAVIRGEEISVSVMLGARYGRGTLLFPDGREFPIYWRGPSAGVDMGATGNKSFTLVYNIDEPQDLYRRF
ncbi:MAG: EipA family protein, partial [Parvibaculales bacterium]